MASTKEIFKRLEVLKPLDMAARRKYGINIRPKPVLQADEFAFLVIMKTSIVNRYVVMHLMTVD